MDENEAIVEAVLPTIADIAGLNHYMRAYLSYRACGFTFREACKLADVGETTVRRWRETYPEFAQLDSPEGIKELVDKFRYKYIEFEFIRNFRLVLKKDYDVLAKSIATPELLTRSEENYLLRLRSYYTPEQLDNIRKLFVESEVSEFNFTQLVLQFGQDRLQLKE